MTDSPDEPVGEAPPPAPYDDSKKEMFAVTFDAVTSDLAATYQDLFVRQIGMCTESYRAAYRERFGVWPAHVMVRVSCDVQALPEQSDG